MLVIKETYPTCLNYFTLQDLGPKTFSLTLVQNEPTVNTVLPGPLTLTVLDDDGDY